MPWLACEATLEAREVIRYVLGSCALVVQGHLTHSVMVWIEVWV